MEKVFYRLRDVEHVVEIVVGVVVHALADREDEALHSPHIRSKFLRKTGSLEDLECEMAQNVAREGSWIHLHTPEQRFATLERC